MAEKKKGFIYKMIVGKEKDEDYARSTLPTSRWSLFWDIFKGRLGKLALVNLLMLIFLLPVFAIIFMNSSMISSVEASLPFLGGIGVGFPANVDLGFEYLMQVNGLNNFYALLLIPASIIASVGIAGGFYIMRNIVWTEGTFVANDFWRGIKKNILPIGVCLLILSVVVYGAVINFSTIKNMEYTDGPTFWTVSAQIATWLLLGFLAIMALYGISFSVTYELSPWQLLKNSFTLTIGLLPHNILFVALALTPLLIYFILSLFMGSIVLVSIIIMVYVFIGISIFTLVWTNFTQWAFDKFVNDNVAGAIKNRGIYPKVKDAEMVKERKNAEIEKFKKEREGKRAVKPVTDKKVTLTDLSKGFTRDALAKLAAEKEAIKKDAEIYAREHTSEYLEAHPDVLEKEIAEELEENNIAIQDDDVDNFAGYEEAMLLEGLSEEEVFGMKDKEEQKELTEEEKKRREKYNKKFNNKK